MISDGREGFVHEGGNASRKKLDDSEFRDSLFDLATLANLEISFDDSSADLYSSEDDSTASLSAVSCEEGPGGYKGTSSGNKVPKKKQQGPMLKRGELSKKNSILNMTIGSLRNVTSVMNDDLANRRAYMKAPDYTLHF